MLIQIYPPFSDQSFAAPRPFSMENRGRIRSRRRGLKHRSVLAATNSLHRSRPTEHASL